MFAPAEQTTVIVLDQPVGEKRWRWRTASGQAGCSRIELLGLQPGDRLVVGLRWHRAAWQVTRYVRIPDHAWAPDPAAPGRPTITVNGSSLAVRRDDSVQPADVRPARAYMNPRSTAPRDAGRCSKMRPAVVAWVDDVRHAGVHFLFDVNSAARREGLGRRLEHWRAAGLRKPSVASTEQHVIRLEDLGTLIGRLSPTDRAALRIGPTH